MAEDAKYGSVEIPGIPADEPVFIIRAQDKSACDAIFAYHDEAEIQGASPEFLTAVKARIREFETWQEAHPERVKVPD